MTFDARCCYLAIRIPDMQAKWFNLFVHRNEISRSNVHEIAMCQCCCTCALFIEITLFIITQNARRLRTFFFLLVPFIFQRNGNELSDCGYKVQNQSEQAKSMIIQLLSFFSVGNSFHRSIYYFIRIVLCTVLNAGIRVNSIENKKKCFSIVNLLHYSTICWCSRK